MSRNLKMLLLTNYNRIISDCIFRFYKHNYIIEKVLEKKKFQIA